MSELMKELLADRATELIHGSFTGVEATWWWERRINGGVEICQELDPRAMIGEVSTKTGEDPDVVRRVVEDELGLEDLDPVVLTFEVPGERTEAEAAALLRDRSLSPKGLAAAAYGRVEDALGGGFRPSRA